MISEDKNLVFTALEIVPPSLEKLNNGQEFFIMNFVSSLSKNNFSQKVYYRMTLTQIELNYIFLI